MSQYPLRHGATVFFTVNLADRSSGLFVQEVAAQTLAARPRRKANKACLVERKALRGGRCVTSIV